MFSRGYGIETASLMIQIGLTTNTNTLSYQNVRIIQLDLDAVGLSAWPCAEIGRPTNIVASYPVGKTGIVGCDVVNTYKICLGNPKVFENLCGYLLQGQIGLSTGVCDAFVLHGAKKAV